MKLRKKVNIFLISVYLLTFVINLTSLMLTTGLLRNSYIDFYEKEIRILIDKAEQENSMIFSGYLSGIMEAGKFSKQALLDSLHKMAWSDNVFIFDVEKGYLSGADRFSSVLNRPDFNLAHSRYLMNNELIFNKNNMDSDDRKADPYSVIFRFFPEHGLFIGYGTFYAEFARYFDLSIRAFTRTTNTIGWTSLLVQFIGVFFIILFTMVRLRRDFLIPVEKLNQCMIQIGKGEFEIKLPELRGDEFRSMGSQLSKMANQLQQIIINLEAQVKKVDEREALYKILIENLPQKIYLKDSDSVYVSCNTAFAASVNLVPEEIPHKTDYDLYSTEEAARFRQEDAEVLLKQETKEIDIELKRNNKKHWVHMVKVPVRIKRDNPDYILGIFWDITDRKIVEQEIRDLNTYLEKRVIERTEELLTVNQELAQANRKLEELTLIDPLTGLPNRRSLEKELRQEWRVSLRDKTPLSALMIDVDFFKLFNDNYGHQAGDECLARIAQCIDENITRPRDFCARYGGEEFIVILGQTPAEGALSIARTINAAVEKSAIVHDYSKVKSVITVSIGIATLVPNTDNTADKLISQSDKALYLAKKNGRNRIEVYS